MRASDFEAKFEAGADLTQDIDLGRARRVNEGRPQVLCYIVAGSGDPGSTGSSARSRTASTTASVSGDCARDLIDWIRGVSPMPRRPLADELEGHGLPIARASRRC